MTHPHVDPAVLEIIKALPKVDLHLHLDGCILPSTLLELAREQQQPLPADEPQTLLPYMQVEGQCDNLKQYLERFDLVLPMLQTGEALERTAYEAVQQSAADNGMYIEVRFAPQLHTARGLTAAAAIGHVIEGLQRGERQYGVRAQVIAICMRHHNEALNREVIEAAAQYLGRGLAAVDLAGDEAGFPPELFRSVFALAAQHGLPATIHAGEAGGPANIREAIHGLGAVRIGHGVRLREDPALLAEVRSLQVPLEMCPVSNIQTRAVTDWSDYPIRDYLEQGLFVTVNTDNPTVSGTTMTREYSELAARFGFRPAEIATLILNSIEAAWLDAPAKDALRQRLLSSCASQGIQLHGHAHDE
ncbi:adenosine deaminase [Paenibacillus daejeonensis]|uniref:adenosine deaminase n=1 Tax=Paenibacillus daejeonensis TaxID=135193 RepID=UPI0003658992|nr:adenosine deaminase [Paenibacillus daejeonensis]